MKKNACQDLEKKFFLDYFWHNMLRFTQDILLALRAISNEEEAHEMSKKAREQFQLSNYKRLIDIAAR